MDNQQPTTHGNWFSAQEKKGAVVALGDVIVPLYNETGEKNGILNVNKDGTSHFLSSLGNSKTTKTSTSRPLQLN